MSMDPLDQLLASYEVDDQQTSAAYTPTPGNQSMRHSINNNIFKILMFILQSFFLSTHCLKEIQDERREPLDHEGKNSN
jgi:hypothetical protein